MRRLQTTVSRLPQIDNFLKVCDEVKIFSLLISAKYIFTHSDVIVCTTHYYIIQFISRNKQRFYKTSILGI